MTVGWKNVANAPLLLPNLVLTNLGQQLDSIQARRDPDAFAVSLLHADHRRLTERPAARAYTQLGRQHDYQFELRPCLHTCLGIEKNAVRTEVAGEARRLSAVGFSDLDGRLYRHATAGTSFGSMRR